MQDDRQHIDDLFKDQFAGFESPVPEYLWDGIRERLDGRRKKRAGLVWWGAAASVAALVLFSTGFYLAKNIYADRPLAVNDTSGKAVTRLPRHRNYTNNQQAAATKFTDTATHARKEEGKNTGDANLHLRQKMHGDVLKAALSHSSVEENRYEPVLGGEDVIPGFVYAEIAVSSAVDAASEEMANAPDLAVTDTVEAVLPAWSDQPEGSVLRIAENQSTSRSSWQLGSAFSPGSRGGYDQDAVAMAGSPYWMDQSGQLTPANTFSYDASESSWALTDQSAITARGLDKTTGLSAIYVEPIDTTAIEKAPVLFSLGASASYNIGRKWSLQTGLYYHKRVTALNSAMTMKLGYLEVPLIFTLKALDRKYNVFLLSGVTASMLVDNRVVNQPEGPATGSGRLEGVRGLYPSLVLGSGFEYPLFGRFSLSIEPTLKYRLAPILATSQSKEYPLSMSLYAGFKYAIPR